MYVHSTPASFLKNYSLLFSVYFSHCQVLLLRLPCEFPHCTMTDTDDESKYLNCESRFISLFQLSVLVIFIESICTASSSNQGNEVIDISNLASNSNSRAQGKARQKGKDVIRVEKRAKNAIIPSASSIDLSPSGISEFHYYK